MRRKHGLNKVRHRVLAKIRRDISNAQGTRAADTCGNFIARIDLGIRFAIIRRAAFMARICFCVNANVAWGKSRNGPLKLLAKLFVRRKNFGGADVGRVVQG